MMDLTSPYPDLIHCGVDCGDCGDTNWPRLTQNGSRRLCRFKHNSIKFNANHMAGARVPAEILDLVSAEACVTLEENSLIPYKQILDCLLLCDGHPWASRRKPCLNWHDPSQITIISVLRLVSKDLCSRMTPAVFNHILLKGPRRASHLSRLLSSPLMPFIQTLRVEISPKDIPNPNHADPFIPPSSNPVIPREFTTYFAKLHAHLVPLLRNLPNVRTMQLTTSYDGVVIVPGFPKGRLLAPCFETLCRTLRDAEMPKLEELLLGVPYEGGYEHFFRDPSRARELRRVGKGVNTASVKLVDGLDNFVIMAMF